MLLNTDMAWWEGSNSVKHFYWDGQHSPNEHVCACSSTTSCISELVTCNCDQGAPQWMTDEGVLTDVNALPVKELAFGGLEYDGQQAQFELGPLSCSGKKVEF